MSHIAQAACKPPKPSARARRRFGRHHGYRWPHGCQEPGLELGGRLCAPLRTVVDTARNIHV
eukprot:7058784-Prymnesium_polylepis.1